MVELPNENDVTNRRQQLDALFTCLASSDRRRFLGILSDQASEHVPIEALGTAFAARTLGKSRDEVADEERQNALATLHHVHLPHLEAAELVEHDTDDDTVGLTDHRAFRDPGVREVIEGEAHASTESLDGLFRAIADARRRTVLHVLSHQFGPIHVETLASELGAFGTDTAESAVPEANVERIVGQLVHTDLPHLAEAALIEYDADAETVEYAGHPTLRVPWMQSVLHPEFRQHLTGESAPEGIGEIEGRKQVISFGQSLCDRADEELFCMFTDTHLLEAGCLTRIRDAARERDVDVYLGTRDPTIRAYIQENAPEVVLWEPNTDWLNLPAAGDRVGRLLLADREAVMLGTLLEDQSDGVHEEQSIVGEGEHNTLVTMICQLLGPHLETIDEDAEAIEARIPL